MPAGRQLCPFTGSLRFTRDFRIKCREPVWPTEILRAYLRTNFKRLFSRTAFNREWVRSGSSVSNSGTKTQTQS